MAKMKDFAPNFVTRDGKVFAWDESDNSVVLDLSNPEPCVNVNGRHMSRQSAEALLLSLTGALVLEAEKRVTVSGAA